jgi:hypothetical protein
MTGTRGTVTSEGCGDLPTDRLPTIAIFRCFGGVAGIVKVFLVSSVLAFWEANDRACYIRSEEVDILSRRPWVGDRSNRLDLTGE